MILEPTISNLSLPEHMILEPMISDLKPTWKYDPGADDF